MKKLSLFLAAAIAISVFTPVMAESELESVVSDVKSRIEIAEYENFESSYYQPDGEEKIYNLSWNNGSSEEYEFVEVSYQDGFITSYTYSKYDDRSREKKFPKVSLGEAEEIARAFSAKINPQYSDKIKLINDNNATVGGKTYYFTLQRFEQGFPVMNETGTVRVDNETGVVTRYDMYFDTDAEFPIIGEPIEEYDAFDIYKSELAPTLQYARYYDYQTQQSRIFAKYVSETSSRRVNALTGEIIELPTNDRLYAANGLMMDTAESGSDSGGGFKLSAAEIAEIEKVEALISQDDAEKAARACGYIGLGDSDMLSSSRLTSDYSDKDRYYYMLTFEGEESYTRVGIDAKTAEIISFSKNGDYVKEYTHDSEAELEKAEELFKNLAGDKSDEYRLEKNEDGSVTFARYVNDVMVSFDQTYMRFDDKGEIVSYSMAYSENAVFPKLDGIMTSDEICDAVCERYDFAPMFAIDGSTNTAVLFYTFTDNNIETGFQVDPYSGKTVNYKGEIVEDSVSEKITYSDIEGHWGENQIKKLAEYGIGFSGGQLLGSASITQKEIVELFGVVFGGSSEYDYLLDKATYDENAPITKEDASVLFVKMLGGDDYAKYEEIFTSPFADVTKNKGYISILKALKVVNGTPDGNFYPENMLTRAEALIMMYNYLSR